LFLVLVKSFSFLQSKPLNLEPRMTTWITTTRAWTWMRSMNDLAQLSTVHLRRTRRKIPMRRRPITPIMAPTMFESLHMVATNCSFRIFHLHSSAPMQQEVLAVHSATWMQSFSAYLLSKTYYHSSKSTSYHWTVLPFSSTVHLSGSTPGGATTTKSQPPSASSFIYSRKDIRLQIFKDCGLT